MASGKGALELLREGAYQKMLLVMHPGQQQTDRIIRAAGNPETEIFEAAEWKSSMKRAVEGSSAIKAFEPDLVVALGETGTLELGKAMRCFSKHACALAVIPTSVGAGSEISARVSLTYNGRFHELGDPGMKPTFAILDDDLIRETPRGQIAEDGFALIAAALESYTGIRGGLLSDLHAREAFVSGWAALSAAFTGKGQALKRLQTASVLTGLALDSTGYGLCRAMENSLGIVFGLSRGKLSGILLPAIIGCNGHAAGRRYAELSRAAGMGGSREEIATGNLKTGLVRLRRELGLPGTLVQAGVDLRRIWNNSKRIVDLTLEDSACRNNPVMVDDFLVRRILDEVTGRI